MMVFGMLFSLGKIISDSGIVRGMNDRSQVPSRRVAVVMQRRAVESRWLSEVWEPVGVLEDEAAGAPRLLVDHPEASQWFYPGFDIVLRFSEAEGYYHNVSTQQPRVFVLWRMEEGRAVPQFVTVSYDEASRWMDGGESVDSVAMPPALFAWVGEFVERNYRAQPKKRIKPQSFLSPKDRAGR
jgi:hypothetical protein